MARRRSARVGGMLRIVIDKENRGYQGEVWQRGKIVVGFDVRVGGTDIIRSIAVTLGDNSIGSKKNFHGRQTVGIDLLVKAKAVGVLAKAETA